MLGFVTVFSHFHWLGETLTYYEIRTLLARKVLKYMPLTLLACQCQLIRNDLGYYTTVLIITKIFITLAVNRQSLPE